MKHNTCWCRQSIKLNCWKELRFEGMGANMTICHTGEPYLELSCGTYLLQCWQNGDNPLFSTAQSLDPKEPMNCLLLILCIYFILYLMLWNISFSNLDNSIAIHTFEMSITSSPILNKFNNFFRLSHPKNF